MSENNNIQTEQNLNDQLRIRREKLAALVAEGRDPFTITKYDVTHHAEEVRDGFDALEGKSVSVAGRLMSKRIMGKASFCHVQDRSGTIQAYVARDSLGDESYADFKKLDVGDIIGLSGEVFRTKTGEVSSGWETVTVAGPVKRSPLQTSVHTPSGKNTSRETFSSSA